jgi:hypothetical protein
MLNLEVVGIALSAGTLIVIAATAAVAMVQLRHLRASNQLSALLEILDQWNQPHFQSAYTHLKRDVPRKLADDDYLRRLRAPGSLDRGTFPEFLIFDFWEQVGTYAKHGLVDERIILDITASQVLGAWRQAWPVIKIARERAGPSSNENFEYLAVKALRWIRRFPDGTYPRGLPRMEEPSAPSAADAPASPPA